MNSLSKIFILSSLFLSAATAQAQVVADSKILLSGVDFSCKVITSAIPSPGFNFKVRGLLAPYGNSFRAVAHYNERDCSFEGTANFDANRVANLIPVSSASFVLVCPNLNHVGTSRITGSTANGFMLASDPDGLVVGSSVIQSLSGSPASQTFRATCNITAVSSTGLSDSPL